MVAPQQPRRHHSVTPVPEVEVGRGLDLPVDESASDLGVPAPSSPAPEGYASNDELDPIPEPDLPSPSWVIANGDDTLPRSPCSPHNAPVAPSSSPAPELRLNSTPFRVTADTVVDASRDHHKRRGPRSLSPPAPAVKRLRHDINVTVCHGPNANCLQPGRWLEGTLILHILRQVVALSPISMRVVDPLLVKGQPLPARVVDDLTCPPKFTAILAPVHLGEAGGAQHWVLAAISPTSVRILDSLPGATDKAEVRAKLRHVMATVGLEENAEISFQQCPSQRNSVDCGVAVIVNAIHIVARRPIPSPDTCDYGIWRRVLIALATGGPLELHHPEVQVLPPPHLTTSAISMQFSSLPARFSRAEFRAWQQAQTSEIEARFDELDAQRRRSVAALEATLAVLRGLLSSTTSTGRQFTHGISFNEIEVQMNHCMNGMISDEEQYGELSPEFRRRCERIRALRALDKGLRGAVKEITVLVGNVEAYIQSPP